MAGLVPAIHVLANRKKGVDARVKPGHDESVGRLKSRRKSTIRVTAVSRRLSLLSSLPPQRKCVLLKGGPAALRSWSAALPPPERGRAGEGVRICEAIDVRRDSSISVVSLTLRLSSEM